VRYSALKNSVTLKPGVGVVQGHSKWRRLIDYMGLPVGPPVQIYIALSCAVFSVI